MVAVNYTVAFHAAEARPVEVQCAVAPGLASFQIIGLANKAVSEAHERVRAALDALSIALPSKRITVNLSPADMPKGGSHFDLPIVVALLSALGMIPQEEIGACVLMGELALGGYLADPAKACARAPDCGADYLGRISGPLLDRFDLRVDVPPVAYSDLELPCDSAPSAEVALRITAAHTRQSERYAKIPNCMVNADAEGAVLQTFATPNADGQALLIEISERFGLTARGYHRVMRVARTIAELAASEVVERAHIAEAASFRLPVGRGPSQPRKSRKAAAAAQPEKMAMANESSP